MPDYRRVDVTIEAAVSSDPAVSFSLANSVARLSSAVMALVISLLPWCSASAQSIAVQDNEADRLTKEILRNEIELMRMTANFRANNVVETRTHKWSDAFLKVAAYSTADAGNVVTFSNAFRYHTHPQDFSVGRAEAGPFLIMLGESLYLGKSFLLSGLDLWQAHRVKNRGFDRKTFERAANKLQISLSDKLKQRAALVQQSNDTNALEEQAVLQAIADQAVREFCTSYARSKDLQAFRLTSNVLDTYTSGTGAFGGIMLYLAAVQTRPRLAGIGGLGFIPSGIGFMTHEVVAHYVSGHVRKTTEAKLLAQNNLAAGTAEAVNSIISKQAAGSPRRHVYEQLGKSMQLMDSASERENKLRFERYVHEQTINTIEGGANIAAGTIIAKAGLGFKKGVGLQQLVSARHFLTRFGTGAIVFTPSATGGMIDTPAAAYYTAVKEHNACTAKQCTQAMLAERISLLEDAQSSLEH